MKKLVNFLLISIFTLLSIFSFSIWQESNSMENVMNSLDPWWVPNDPALQGNKINYIDTKFCNDWFEQSKLKTELSLVIKPWEEKEICVIHFNRHREEDIYLRWAFAGHIIEPNWNMVCGTDHTRDNVFSKFMKPFEENFIKVPAKWSVVRKTTIKFPIWVNWLQKACFARWISPWKLAEWENFLFVVRKVNEMNILIQWDSKIESKLDIKNISNQIDQNKKLQIQFDIENNWSINEILQLRWTLSNMFGYQQTFQAESIIISTNEKKSFDTKDFGIDIEIPRYKWPFKLDLEITHKPHFDFDISNYWIDSKLLEWWSFNYTKSVFLFPTLPLIWIIVFLALIYMAFFKKPKVIIQQIPVNNPNPPQQ